MSVISKFWGFQRAVEISNHLECGTVSLVDLCATFRDRHCVYNWTLITEAVCFSEMSLPTCYTASQKGNHNLYKFMLVRNIQTNGVNLTIAGDILQNFFGLKVRIKLSLSKPWRRRERERERVATWHIHSEPTYYIQVCSKPHAPNSLLPGKTYFVFTLLNRSLGGSQPRNSIRTHRWTDRHDEANISFSKFCDRSY